MAIHVKMTELKHNGIKIPGPLCDEDEVAARLHKMSCNAPYTGLPFRMLYAYARINPELEHKHNPKFQKRFFEAFVSEMPSDAGKHFPEDYQTLLDAMYQVSLQLKEEKAAYNKAHKEEIKAAKEAEKEQFGFAIVNGNKEPLGGYVIEPEAIFFGRGDSPFNGYWKYAVTPEDIEINYIGDGEAPKAPEGHHWKAVVADPDRHEVATYHIRIGTKNHTVSSRKKIQFGATSSLKNEADKLKFDNAAKLSDCFDQIMSKAMANLSSNNPIDAQTAALVWLIANTGIRVGSDKEGTEWDNGTVGASTILVENAELNGNILHLDFLGKDSVHDVRDIELDENVARAIGSFMAGKTPKQQVFDMANEGTVNSFLQSIMPSATAKLLRTYVANDVMQKALDKVTKELPKNATEAELVDAFKRANLEVAKQLNHQTNVSKGYKAAVEKMTANIDARKTSLDAATLKKKAEIAKYKKMLKATEVEELKIQLKQKIAKAEEQLQKKANSLKAAQLRLSQKKMTKNTALGTSLNAYISPAVVYAWAKSVNLPIEKIYNKSLMAKYAWAFEEE